MYYDELYHHGIPGMRWGVRRYQNKDGSLTAEGIKRYRTDLKFKAKYDKYTAKQEEKKAAKAREAEIKRADKLKKTPLNKLTAAELEERYKRLQQEKTVRDMEASIVAPNQQNKGPNNQNNNQQNQNKDKNTNKVISEGKNFAGKIMSTAATTVAVGIGKKMADKALTGMFGGDKKTANTTMDEIKKAVQSSIDANNKEPEKKASGNNSSTTSSDSGKNKTENVSKGKDAVSGFWSDVSDYKTDWKSSNETVSVGKSYFDNVWDNVSNYSSDWGTVTSYVPNGSENVTAGGYTFTYDKPKSRGKWNI